MKRDGLTIYSDLTISFTTAALGGEAVIPTVYGNEKYTIRAGTQSETRITLRGKGAPNVRNPRQVGDMVVTVKVAVPTQLTERQKELLRELENENESADGSGKGKKKFWNKNANS
jgi:molecular chaperone DnaJ